MTEKRKMKTAAKPKPKANVKPAKKAAPKAAPKKAVKKPVAKTTAKATAPKQKPKLAFYWGAACGGCEVSLLDTNEKLLDIAAFADIVLMPLAVDGKYKDIEAMPDGGIDICFFNGGVRNSETEHIAKLLRSKSKVMIAYGACAMMGGVPGLANQYDANGIFERVYRTSETTAAGNTAGVRPQTSVKMPEGEVELPTLFERVLPLAQVVDVDYFLPGCPPTVDWILKAVNAIVSGALPAKGSVIGLKKTLCDECPRKRDNKRSIKKFYRPHEIIPVPDKCLLEQGIICSGPATRGGCGARCITANMPCRGCFGAPDGVADQGAKLLSAVASLIDGRDDAEIEKIIADIKDPMGVFYQFNLAGSFLKGRVGKKA